MVNPENPSLSLQIAVKNTANNTVFYFAAPIAMEALMASTPAMETQALAGAWKSLDESMEVSVVVNDLPTVQIDAISQKLKAHNISFVATRELPNMPGQSVSYFSCKTVTN